MSFLFNRSPQVSISASTCSTATPPVFVSLHHPSFIPPSNLPSNMQKEMDKEKKERERDDDDKSDSDKSESNHSKSGNDSTSSSNSSSSSGSAKRPSLHVRPSLSSSTSTSSSPSPTHSSAISLASPAASSPSPIASHPPLLHSASLLSTNIFFIESVLYSSPLYGHLYDDSKYFDDRNFLSFLTQYSHIVEIRIWSREFIHGMQVVYEIQENAEEAVGINSGSGSSGSGPHKLVHGGHSSNLNEIKDKDKDKDAKLPTPSAKKRLVDTPRHLGSIHTTEYSMKVNHSLGEFIIGLEGTYKEFMESLTIVTNQRKHTFGTINTSAQYGASHFVADIPMGHRLVAFRGGYGFHLHHIGVFHQPVSMDDNVGKGKKIVNKIKTRLFG